MSPRTGRPVIGKPKTNDLKVRLDDDSLRQLDEYCHAHELNRAEAVRMGIDVFFKLKKELENAQIINADLKRCLSKPNNPQVPRAEQEETKKRLEENLKQNEFLIDVLERQLKREYPNEKQ